ncbi:MAG TPA: hypothetical protein VK152_10570 [Paludibacter sp.]|nr:hypothetical protein [Paludibacter sp.]
MNKLKFATALVATFAGLNLIFAGNPKKGMSVESFADMIVSSLAEDVQLTDSQRLVIREYTKVFVSDANNDSVGSTDLDKSKRKIQVYQRYESMVDSILSNDQRTQRHKKAKEREARNDK